MMDERARATDYTWPAGYGDSLTVPQDHFSVPLRNAEGHPVRSGRERCEVPPPLVPDGTLPY